MNQVLSEAKRLYDLGFAIIWLHPKSKRPVESKWTSGDRTTWKTLLAQYKEGMNVGVRTGEASQIGIAKNYLACIDVDIKDPAFKEEALEKIKEITNGLKLPEVRSGAGNGSRHLYCVTDKPFKMITVLKKGKEIGEICIYSTGRQMVLPPSIHPESGKTYKWVGEGLSRVVQLPLLHFEQPETKEKPGKLERVSNEGTVTRHDFKVKPVDLDWLPISKKVLDGIKFGTGVKDRSGYLLRASSALLSAGLDVDEVLTVLTDRDLFIGECGYDHAKTNDRARAADWVYKYSLRKIEGERSATEAFEGVPVAELPPLSKEEAEKQAASLKAERHWTQDLARGGQRGEGAPKPTIENVVLILKNEVAPNIFCRNLFAFRDTYLVDTPWGGKKGDVLADDDIPKIKYWLGQHWNFEPGKEVVQDAMTVIACANAFDPVRDQIDALPAWDGVKRLGGWLKENFEAEGDDEYLDQVFTKWMVAMIARAYEPGTKFDWMPIFEGAQGVGKSSFGRLLVGDMYFLDWLPNLASADSALALQGMWCVEMGELSHFRKNEIEVIKGYITRTVDKVRPPYGRRWIESPRRCVFFGTTNRDTYLRDDTGNRRFKPLKVGRLNFKLLREERVQLFSEAREIYRTKMKSNLYFELTGEAKIFERKMHGEKMVMDDANLMVDLIQDFMQKTPENGSLLDFSKFRIHDLFSGGSPLNRFKLDSRNIQFAGRALKYLGAKHWKSDGIMRWSLEIPTKREGLDDDPSLQDFY